MAATTLGQRVLLRRRELGWSQKKLAEFCGFPYQVISGLERGHQDISSARLAVLARALGCTPNDLLGFADENEIEAAGMALVGT